MGCSAKNHPHLLKKLPKLFTFHQDRVKSEKVCAKQTKLLQKSDRDYTSCELVNISLHSFLAPTASLCLLRSAVTTNSVQDNTDCGQVDLVKVSEIGLDQALQSLSSPATAQVYRKKIYHSVKNSKHYHIVNG